MTERAIGPSPPGFAVTGYDVVELLGFGATGEVWLARETASGESVALKRLRTPRDLAARDRLRREAAVLSCVDHPHVVRLRAVLGAGDDLVLVLDHAGGGSLAGLLAARRLTAGEIVTVAVPLAGALAAVHARGLVHGDVTPANVLFTSDGRPLLSDLGVCQLVGERQGSPEVVAGTPGFLDPAVLVGEPPGPAADVHGLAAVCFAALTGRPPYDEVGARLPLLTDAGLAMPPALVAVIEAALDPDPHRRPSADELAVAVFESCPAQPVHLRTGRRPSADNSSAPALTHEVRVRPVRSSEPAAVARPRRRRHGRERAPVHRVLPALRPMRPLQTLRALPLRPAVGMLLVVCGVSMAVLAGVCGPAATGGGARQRSDRHVRGRRGSTGRQCWRVSTRPGQRLLPPPTPTVWPVSTPLVRRRSCGTNSCLTSCGPAATRPAGCGSCPPRSMWSRAPITGSCCESST
ncbi:MAG: serine/threonine-protein kinase [Sporichthyaceae bacterium]